MGFLIILAVILVNYIKNRSEIPERSKRMYNRKCERFQKNTEKVLTFLKENFKM
jgi:hypothetical protein